MSLVGQELLLSFTHCLAHKSLQENKMSSTVQDGDNDIDIYRDTPLRLMGYANEVGEAFRALVHVNWVRLSYALSISYVLADTNDKANISIFFF